MLTSAVFLYPALVLFLCSSCAQGRRSLPEPRGQAPAGPPAYQNNGDQRWDKISYQAPIELPDMTVNTRMSDYNDAVPVTYQETSADEGGREHIVQAAVEGPYHPSDGEIFNTSLSDLEEESSTSEPIQPMPDVFDAFKEKYKLEEGLGYYRVVKGRKFDWEQARADCLAQGAHLAVVNSRFEAVTLGRLFFEKGIKPDLVHRTAWVGAYRPKGQQHFVTVHGTPLQKTGFCNLIGETHSNITEERCVLFHASEVNFISSSCRRSDHHICEHEL